MKNDIKISTLHSLTFKKLTSLLAPDSESYWTALKALRSLPRLSDNSTVLSEMRSKDVFL